LISAISNASNLWLSFGDIFFMELSIPEKVW